MKLTVSQLKKIIKEEIESNDNSSYNRGTTASSFQGNNETEHSLRQQLGEVASEAYHNAREALAFWDELFVTGLDEGHASNEDYVRVAKKILIAMKEQDTKVPEYLKTENFVTVLNKIIKEFK